VESIGRPGSCPARASGLVESRVVFGSVARAMGHAHEWVPGCELKTWTSSHINQIIHYNTTHCYDILESLRKSLEDSEEFDNREAKDMSSEGNKSPPNENCSGRKELGSPIKLSAHSPRASCSESSSESPK